MKILRTILAVCYALAFCYGCASKIAQGPDGGAAPAASVVPFAEMRAGVEAEASRTTLEVHFSPKGGCSDAIVQLLDEAKSSVRVQAYGFTSAPIANAIARAKARGVDTRIIFDRSDLVQPATNERSLVFREAGVPMLFDFKHVIAHNKVIVVDAHKVETGSYNFTTVAETGNAENCLIVTNDNLASEYVANWAVHAAHSWPGDAAARD